MEILDNLDIEILRILQNDASTSTREIGDRLFKSHSTVQNRIDAMKKKGVIKRFTVEIDPDKVGLDFISFTNVQLAEHSKDTLTRFEQEIIKFPEVLECHHLTGGHDFTLRIAAYDRKHYHEVLMDKLFASFRTGHVETKLIMKTAKAGGPLPIRVLK